MLYKYLFQFYISLLQLIVKFSFRAEYTKEIVNPVLGEQGVGGAMAVYGVFDAIVSLMLVTTLCCFKG